MSGVKFSDSRGEMGEFDPRLGLFIELLSSASPRIPQFFYN
jgi:hypothetical protein